MVEEEKAIKALATYYSVANAEYDRIHGYFDQIDNKVGFLVAVVIGVPIASIGFASQLGSENLDVIALILGGIGALAFLIAGGHLIRTIRIRDVKLGVPYREFGDYCQCYEDQAMQEWVANILIKSSEFNYREGVKKAEHLQTALPFLALEVVFLLAAVTYVLVRKL